MTTTTRDVEGGVRIVTLDRPPANAISHDLLVELQGVCEAAESDDTVRAVVVTGSGKFFSGGIDIQALGAGAAASGWNPATFGTNDGVFALWTLPKPTVAMVNGHAIAGGAILAWACDVRIAARGDTRIGLNELAIGIAPPRAAYEIGRLALTHQRMWRIGLGAELHDADTACALGMIDGVVDPGDLERRCLAEARRLGSYPREAYAHCKRMVQRDAVRAVVDEPDEHVRALVEVWRSPETVQALKAQLARMSTRREPGHRGVSSGGIGR